jgi:hypothetical protein
VIISDNRPDDPNSIGESGVEGGGDNGGDGDGGGNDSGRLSEVSLEGHIAYIAKNGNDYRYDDDPVTTIDGNSRFDPMEELSEETLNNTISITPSEPSEANPDVEGYKYTAWGTWAQSGLVMTANNGEEFNLIGTGHYVIGQPTLNMPTSGTATYNGSIQGDYISSYFNGGEAGIVESNAISGTINITADFGDSSVNANMQANRNGTPWAEVNTTGNIYDNYFDNDGNSNNVVTGGGNAKISGTFFGTNADEVGGGFSIDKLHDDGGAATGVFRAKH